mgnify:CR=1 FL=1
MEVERREWKVESCTRLSAVHCRGAACPSRHCTGGKCGPMLKRQWPPSLSLRGRFAPVAISGRHSQPVQAAVKMGKADIWGVAAVSDRHAGWQCLRHKFIGAMPSGLSLRGGRRPTWQSRSTRPDHRKAIGENAAAFPRLPRRFAPRNDTSGSAVVHQRPPTVELPCTGRSLSAATVKFDSDCVRRHSVYIGSAFPRLPRRFAPRNDTSGWCGGAPVPLCG